MTEVESKFEDMTYLNKCYR